MLKLDHRTWTDWDAFSVASAVYWYAAHNYSGQGDRMYALMGRLNYKPGEFERGPDTEDAARLYKRLTRSSASDWADELDQFFARKNPSRPEDRPPGDVANTIARQLGGALAMIGARDLVDTGSGLAFAVGRNPAGVNKIMIDLDDDDTYTVDFFKGRGWKIKSLGPVFGAHADSLATVIERRTGLRTRL
jgi:hypothetical protein